MTVEATVLRVVGYILSLPSSEQAREVNRLRRYARLYSNQLPEAALQYIDAGDFATLYQSLFPIVHKQALSEEPFVYESPTVIHFDKASRGVGDTDVESVQNNVEASGDDADSSNEAPVVQEVKESSEMQDEHTETNSVADNQIVDGADDEVRQHPQSEDGDAQPAASSEEEWPEDLRRRLLKRYRSPRKKRSYTPSEDKKSRWEFWHANVGLLKLTDWLSQTVLDDVSQAIFMQTIEQLALHEMYTVGDLLLKAPTDYQKYPFSTLDRNISEGTTTLRGKISQKYVIVDSMLKRWVVVLHGKDDLPLTCSWAGHPPRGWERWSIESTVGFVGEVQLDDGLHMSNAEPIGLDGRGSGLLASYGLDGLSDQQLRNLIAQVIQHIGIVQDSLPKEILDGSGVLSLEDALREAHFPANQNYKGRSRLAFEEVFLYHVGKRLNSKFVASNGVSNRIQHSHLARFSWMQNIQLSDAQELVLSDIRRDLLSSEPMRRLLQGDVGSGKPMVALFAALSLFDNRKATKGKSARKPLVVYLCDDELSAERRFGFVENAFKMLGIQCKLLTGKPSKAEYNILESDGGMVVVTNEILKTRLQSLTNIRLVIVEENKDFGTNIPYGFIKRSPSPDLLVFTPTPQPIHILETVYADFALSTITVKDRILPQTRCVAPENRDPVYAKLNSLVVEGRQGLIVWPVKDGKDTMDAKQALQVAGAIQGRYLPDVRMAVYCSSMRTEERLKVFEAYQNKRIDVLLCTTIIEDTPAVGNSTMIIVEKADHSDVMRLHRLRGHLSNSHYPSECVYVFSDDASEEAISTVERMCDESNGFELAEWLSDDATGLDLKWATQADVGVRMKARKLAHKLSLRDLRRCRWPLLNNAVRNWWDEFEVPEQKTSSNNRRRYNQKRGRNQSRGHKKQ